MTDAQAALIKREPFIKIKSETGIEDVHYSALYEQLPEEFKLYAREKLNETEENKEKGLRKLKTFMQKENLIPIDDYVLLGVLRTCKYNIKKSEYKLKRYLKHYEAFLADLACLDMKTITAVLDDKVYCPLPYRDKHGRVITYSRPNLHFESYTMLEVLTVVKAVLMFLLKFPMTTVAGVAHIGECECPPHIFYPLLKHSISLFRYLGDSPIRVARVDNVNPHFLVRLLYTTVRPFIPEKLYNRVVFNEKGYDCLKKTYHPALLPEEIGGTLGPVSDKFYKEKLMSFIEELKSRRPWDTV